MEKKKASALASLGMILLASFALIAPTLSFPHPESHRYWIMTIDRKDPGNVVVIDSLAEAPIEYAYWNFTIPPLSSSQNITFSDPWLYPGVGWIVNLTVPATSYVGISYMSWSREPPLWFRFVTSMSTNGKGWIFLNATGDVDYHTFSNNSAAYWRSPSPKAGEKAADHGALPSPGPDGVAGTADDGFGDGTNDTRGSSILMLPITMTAEYYAVAPVDEWVTLFTFSWPQVFTTGNASTLVIEPDGGPGPGPPPKDEPSQIDGANQTVVGHPWEFFAGLDQSGMGPVSEKHPKWNAYVTYVVAWSLLDISTDIGFYDSCFTIIEKLVRDDCVIADIDCNELVDIVDIVVCALAFGAKDVEFPDKKKPDPNWDARGDISDARGLIDIVDIVRIAIDFGATLTPDCIIRP